MRTVTCYLRIGRKRGRQRWGASDYVFDASIKQPTAHLTHEGVPVDTVLLKVNLELPENAFGPTAEVHIEVPPEAIRCVVTGEAV